MNCLILNGNPRPTAFDGTVAMFAAALAETGADTRVRALRDETIAYCNGCWSCWWATPGRCAKRDAMEDILPEVRRADLLVFASPLVLGAPSYLVKRCQDRLIPLIHPYIELAEGECHHRRRYERLPELGLIVEAGADDSEADLELVRRLHERLALNLRSRLRFFAADPAAALAAAGGLAAAAAGSSKEARRDALTA
jgi:hypothetical protein